MLQGSSTPYECKYSKTLVVWALFVGLKRGKSLLTIIWLGWVSFLTERLALGEDLFTVHATCLWFSLQMLLKSFIILYTYSTPV